MVRGVEMKPRAKLVNVIEIVFNRGKGIPGDPVREVRQYWSTDGQLLAECDTWENKLVGE